MNYKQLFFRLGIEIRSFANMMFLSEQTLHTWFNRRSMIPIPYSGYFNALDDYAGAVKTEDIEQIGNEWASEESERLETHKNQALKEINAKMAACEVKLLKMMKKAEMLRKRGHFARHYAAYLPAPLQENEETKIWLSIIERKSKLKYGDALTAVRECEAKLAALKAEAAYWSA